MIAKRTENREQLAESGENKNERRETRGEQLSFTMSANFIENAAQEIGVTGESLPKEQLVHVSTTFIVISALPLLMIAFISWLLELELVGPIAVGTLRTFFQLSILGLILVPIFVRGTEYWWIVVLYVCFMVLLASKEASSRCKYYFRGQFIVVLLSMLINVGLVSLFAFAVIIRPDPKWDPQYVIPICGMLLGNIINGSSLSLNAMVMSFVEQHREVELWLSFGASSLEASSRLIRESARTGTVPILNSMAIIGLISIPGMMTGQILGGSPVMEAARYQILIMYLIAVCVFGTIFMELWMTVQVAFDSSNMLRTDRFKNSDDERFVLWSALWQKLCCCFGHRSGNDSYSWVRDQSGETKPLTDGLQFQGAYVSPKSSLEISTLQPGKADTGAHLEIRRVTRSVPMDTSNIEKFKEQSGRRVLFHNLTVAIGAGEIATIRGPSGGGKTQLLRVVAGLSRIDKGSLTLGGADISNFADMTLWRQRVRYVTQYKVDIPGKPLNFIRRVASLKSFRSSSDAPTFNEMIEMTQELSQSWGLDRACLDKEWAVLSGGEAQRIIVAIALASRPEVLLLDESTSALDLDAKTRVENSIETFASRYGMTVLLITHDQEQVARMGRQSTPPI